MARQQTLEYSCHPLAVPVFTNSKQIIVDTVDTLCRYLGPQKVVCQRLCDEDEGHNTNPTPLLMWDSVSLPRIEPLFQKQKTFRLRDVSCLEAVEVHPTASSLPETRPNSEF